MYEREVNRSFFGWLFLEFFILLYIGFCIPVSLHADVVGPVYKYQMVSERDVIVTTTTLFGRKSVLSVSSGYHVDVSEDMSYVRVLYKNMTCGVYVEPIDVIEIKAVYNNLLYVNQRLNPDNVKITAVYADGTESTVLADISLPDSVSEKQTVTIETKMGTANLELDPIQVSGLSVTYGETMYPGDTFDKTKVSLVAHFSDGTKQSVKSFTCKVPDGKIYGSTDIPVSCIYGNTVLTVAPVEISGVYAKYSGSLYEGGNLDPKSISVWLEFVTGARRAIYAYTYDKTTLMHVKKGSVISVSTEFGSTELVPDVIGVQTVEAVMSSSVTLREGDVIVPESFEITYEDGYAVSVSADNVTDTESWSVPMVVGDNSYSFVYSGVEYAFVVEAKPMTNVTRAVTVFADELAESWKSYVSDNMFVTVRKYRYNEASYYLTHVIINSPSQIHAGLSYDDYGGERETPTHASERLGWVVGVNGGNFSYTTGGADTNMATAIIKNGQAMPDSSLYANGMEICLKSNGVLCASRAGASVADLISVGVTDTFSCGDTQLIVAGSQVNLGVQSEQYRYPRTAVGMVQPGEYYLITAGSGDYSGGMTYDEVREILWAHGCVFGKCMDGGGSSSLVFQNELLNPPATGSERAVSDFLYFTDIDADVVVGDSDFFADMSFGDSTEPQTEAIEITPMD